ncbi:MAG: hypothetical protein MI892_07665 [Desulfobacterales bacterium]|nr:hypothetical protein [Desulfobacterales bacterium]
MGFETVDTVEFKKHIENHPNDTKLLAEGDSWFAYPRRFYFFGKDANIIDHLADKPGLAILNTSRNGDEAADMMSGDQKLSLLKRLKHMDFDAMLFSGGGNDLVGRYDFGFLINEKKGSMDWKACINKDHLDIKIQQLELVYMEMMERILDLKPKFKVITHTYDLALPSKEGFELFDIIPMGKSWMYPYMENKKIHDYNDQKKIIHSILKRFKRSLNKVGKKYKDNLIVVDTHGCVAEDEWRNEIHPTPAGFDKVANKIYKAIQAL